jgi:hypothetical protein
VGTYNGTTTYSGSTTLSASTTSSNGVSIVGLQGSDTVTGLTILSPNVSANATNVVDGFGAGSTALLSNYTLPSRNSTTPVAAGTTNFVTLSPAPLGILVQGIDNGGNVYTDGVNGATLTSSGLVGGDVGKRVRTATLNTPTVTDDSYVSSITSLDFQVGNYVLFGAKSPGSTGTCVDGVCSGTNNGGVNAGGTNRVALTPLAPPPASPVIVPAFPDNGSTGLLADPQQPAPGGMNYVSASFTDSTGSLSGGTTTTAGTSSGTGTATGTATTTTTTTTTAGTSTGGTTTAGTTSGTTSGSSTESTATTGALTFVAITALSTPEGDELRVQLPQEKDRKPQSELNVNNTSVPSNSGQLDVFVVGTGINLNGLQSIVGAR